MPSALHMVRGNAVQLLRSGGEFFPALIAAFDAAREGIYLETYIFADDASGNAVADALLRARARGVDVRLVVDAFGTRPYTTPRLEQALRDAGVQFIYYRPEVVATRWRRERLRRLHRKLVLVDGAVGFVGGINLIDDLNTPRQTPPRIDYAVQVRGPLLQPMVDSAERFWRVLRVAQVSGGQWTPPWTMQAQTQPAGDIRARFVVRDNLRYRHHIERAYLAAFRVARREITLANAYFFPGIRFRHALIDAAQRGVRVTLILQAQVEVRLLRHATRALYGQLLAGGVRIVEFHRGFLHAKVAVADDRWATVGSSNIDPFSLLLAREANVVVRNAGFTATLREELQRLEQQGGRLIDRDTWSRRSRWSRFIDWCGYGLARALIGLAGVGGQRW